MPSEHPADNLSNFSFGKEKTNMHVFRFIIGTKEQFSRVAEVKGSKKAERIGRRGNFIVVHLTRSQMRTIARLSPESLFGYWLHPDLRQGRIDTRYRNSDVKIDRAQENKLVKIRPYVNCQALRARILQELSTDSSKRRIYVR
jgi:hypothetical protein